MTQYTSINMTLCKPDGKTYTYQEGVAFSRQVKYITNIPQGKTSPKILCDADDTSGRATEEGFLTQEKQILYIDVKCADQQKDDKISDRL